MRGLTISKIILLSLSARFLLCGVVRADVIATYDFDGSNDIAGACNAHVIAGSFSLGSGLQDSGYDMGFFGGSPTGLARKASGWTDTITNTAWFGFQFTVRPGYELALSDLTLDSFRKAGRAPDNFQVQFSADGNNFTDFGPSEATGETNIWNSHVVGSAQTNLTNTIMFRICGYGATDTSKSWEVDNVTLNGAVSAVSTNLADLAVTTIAPPSGHAGFSLAYAILITNYGPAAAVNVALTNSWLYGVASPVTLTNMIGSLAANAATTFTFTVAVSSNAVGGMTNVAGVRSDTPDPNQSDNTRTAAVAIVPAVIITSFKPNGDMLWTNSYTAGVCTVEAVVRLTNTWEPRQNSFTTGSIARATLPMSGAAEFYRLRSVDVSAANPWGYTNLLESYGILSTIAGSGAGATITANYWQAGFEGGPATNAALSNPHFAMSDGAGNIFIADKLSHSILKVTPDGAIHTVAGTHVAGNGPDSATIGTNVSLDSPNGEWVLSDGTVYILDLYNGKVRRLDTNGMATTLFSVAGGIQQGRGLWVRDDESLAYFASGVDLKKWTPGDGVATQSTGFVELGNIFVKPDGDIIATDRAGNRVYLVSAQNGSRTVIAGNGATNAVVDGVSALSNSLYGARGIWMVPSGGYILATHEGSQILYLDTAGILRVFVDGDPGDHHSGDGEWFHTPGLKISEVRGVTMDGRGNILITENDSGYVRKIEFLRLAP